MAAIVDTPIAASVSSNLTMVTMKSAQSVQQVQQQATSYSNYQTQFAFTPTDPKAILDCRIELEMELSVKCICNATNVNRTGKVIPRSYGLNSAIVSCDLAINSEHIETSSSIVKLYLERSDVSDELLRHSLPYGQTDRCSTYALERLYVQDNAFLNEANSLSNLPSRGSWLRQTVGGDDDTAGDVTDIWVLREPLLNGALERAIRQRGISNLKQIQVTLLHPDLRQAFSAVYDGRFTSFEVTVNASPKLLTTFEIPNRPVPDLITVPYHKYTIHQKSYGALNHKATKSLVSDNLQFNIVPEKIIIFATPKAQNVKAATDADGFLVINKLSLSVGQVQSRLSAATQRDLHLISVRNGLKMTYEQFSKRLGSIVVLSTASDLGSLIPGSMTGAYLKVEVEVQNMASTVFDDSAGVNASDVQLYILFQTKGRIEITPYSAKSYLGFDPNEGNMVYAEPNMHYNEADEGVAKGDMSGGSFKSFLGNVGNFFSKAKDVVKSVNNQVNPYLNAAANVDPRFAAASNASNNLQSIIGKSLLYG